MPEFQTLKDRGPAQLIMEESWGKKLAIIQLNKRKLGIVVLSVNLTKR
jgi:hypothetical protein